MEIAKRQDQESARRTIVDRVKQQLTTQRGDRIARIVGATALGVGAVHLLAPGMLSRRSSGGLRLLGIAEIAGGVALMRARAAARAKYVQRSITIGAPAEMLYTRWRDPQVMTQIMQPLGSVTRDGSGDGALRWHVSGPLGQSIEWVTRNVEEEPGRRLRWTTDDGAPVASEGSIEFRQDRPDVGMIVTMHVAIPTVVPQILPELLIAKVLRRFKSLVETAEIPTLKNNPSARASAIGH